MALQPPKPGHKGASSAPLDARAREELERQDRHRTEALLDECEKLEEDLEKLKGRFELHFLGVERREPAREREEMKRRVSRLKGEFTRNTGLRFRIETLHARFLSYERMWTRSAREKEEGTYRRDVMKARRRAEFEKRREEQPKDAAATCGESDGAAGAATASPAFTTSPGRSEETVTSRSAATAAVEGVAPSPSAIAAAPPQGSAGGMRPPPLPARSAGAARPLAAPAPRQPAAPLPGGMTEEQLRELHAAYVEAKRRCNEDISRVSYEALARAVAKQVPELMAKYKAKTVEFKVVIKDGRAVLKAVPRV